MDIHAPLGPTHSLKDFAVHILIVTIGILIALGLEGVRETWKEQREINEARESFRRELRADRDHLEKEKAGVNSIEGEIKAAIEKMPAFIGKAGDFPARVASLTPPLYFFKTTAWDSAVASGVLSHMDEEELNRFDNAYGSIRNYQDAQKQTIPEWFAMRAYFASHHTLSAADEVMAEEKLRAFEARIEVLQHLSGEFADGLRDAIGN